MVKYLKTGQPKVLLKGHLQRNPWKIQIFDPPSPDLDFWKMAAVENPSPEVLCEWPLVNSVEISRDLKKFSEFSIKSSNFQITKISKLPTKPTTTFKLIFYQSLLRSIRIFPKAYCDQFKFFPINYNHTINHWIINCDAYIKYHTIFFINEWIVCARLCITKIHFFEHEFLFYIFSFIGKNNKIKYYIIYEKKISSILTQEWHLYYEYYANQVWFIR